MNTSKNIFSWQDFERRFVASKFLLAKKADTDTSRIKQIILKSMQAIYATNVTIDGSSSDTNIVFTYNIFSPSAGSAFGMTTVSLPTTGEIIGDAIRNDLIGWASSLFGQTISPGYAFAENVVADIARSESTVSLTVQTSTGAVGTQVSTTQDSFVFVSENISTTASIAGNAADDLVVEVAPTNSATAGDWVEKARGGQSQALSLAIALQSVQIVKGILPVYVPKGYYLKVRSLGSSGTFSSGVSNSRVVLL